MVAMSAPDARDDLLGVLEMAKTEPVFIEWRGRLETVVLSIHQYEQLRDVLDGGDVSCIGPGLPWATRDGDGPWEIVPRFRATHGPAWSGR